MIAAFFTWFETLGWQAAICFMFALCGILVIAVLLIDHAAHKFSAWREDSAILRREMKRRAEKRDELLMFPFERSRIPRSQIDPAHSTGQFQVPRSMRDFKRGVHKL